MWEINHLLESFSLKGIQPWTPRLEVLHSTNRATSHSWHVNKDQNYEFWEIERQERRYRYMYTSPHQNSSKIYILEFLHFLLFYLTSQFKILHITVQDTSFIYDGTKMKRYVSENETLFFMCLRYTEKCKINLFCALKNWKIFFISYFWIAYLQELFFVSFLRSELLYHSSVFPWRRLFP